MRLPDKRCIVLDMDGTIYMGDNPIKGAVAFVQRHWEDVDFFFLSNNTSKAPETYIKKLNGMGIPARREQLLSPVTPLVAFLKAEGIHTAYVVGNRDFVSDLRQRMPELKQQEEGAQAVILAYDTELTYEKLSRSALLLQKEKAFGHDIWLISDEPYREIAFDGREVPYASRFYPRTISCYSFSKSLSIPGERIGYVAVNPESGVSAMLVNMCGQISRGIGHNCPSSVIQLAAADCCDLTSDLSVYETNMNLLYDALTALGFDVVRPGGTFYLFPKALESDAAAFSRKALPYGLILVPSDSFGLPGYFRIAFCTDTEKVVRSIVAFKAFVKAEY